MFNKDFYPTPNNAIAMLVAGLEFRDTKTLEPSAGKGNIVDYVSRSVMSREHLNIDVLEIEPDLQNFLNSKQCNLVGGDFLSFTTHTEYDQIIMNPPFSDGVRHLLKAIELAEAQTTQNCSIRCILNADTIRNPFSKDRELLLSKIELYQSKVTYHQDLFTDAERKTNIEVAIIKIEVPASSNQYKQVFSEMLKNLETEQVEHFALSTNLKHYEVEKRMQDIYLYVQMYEEHIRTLKATYSNAQSLLMFEKEAKRMIDEREKDCSYNFYTIKDRYQFDNLSEAIQNTRTIYWRLILNSHEFERVLTNDARENLQKMIQDASNLEITKDNIQLLLSSLYQNKSQMMIESLVGLFKDFTKHHMGEFGKNIHYYNGWKTNKAFRVGKKIILREEQWGDHKGYCSYQRKWNEQYISDAYVDLIKALNPLTIDDLTHPLEYLGDGKYENDKFIIKLFKKGTTHITFKDLELLDKFNIVCGQNMNMLPTDYEVKTDIKAREFMLSEYQHYDQLVLI